MNLSTKRLHIVEISLLLALSMTLLFAVWAQNSSAELSSQLIRLHVIADSDDATEQAIKLEVRDAVLAYLAPLLEGANITQAQTILTQNLAQIEETAKAAAYGRAVAVTLSNESYPTRYYDTFALPAGEYNSLQVKIGEANGKNWWCVVYPPLCTDSEVAVSAFSDSGISVIYDENADYIIRFRAMELWGELMAVLEG